MNIFGSILSYLDIHHPVLKCRGDIQTVSAWFTLINPKIVFDEAYFVLSQRDTYNFQHAVLKSYYCSS